MFYYLVLFGSDFGVAILLILLLLIFKINILHTFLYCSLIYYLNFLYLFNILLLIFLMYEHIKDMQ